MPKLAKINGDHTWEVRTCAKSNGHFTKCFECQVHKVLYLCSKEPRTTWGTSPAMTGFLFHIRIRTLYAKDRITFEKHELGKLSNLDNRKLWKGRAPKTPEDPSYEFLQILKMGSISFNKRKLESLEFVIQLKEFEQLKLVFN